MHNESTALGSVIKSARKRSDLTIEELADRVGISERYLYRIENEGKTPSYDVLYAIIRTLAISPDLIFYPERPSKDSEIENLVRLLHSCDDKSLNVVRATIEALLEIQPLTNH